MARPIRASTDRRCIIPLLLGLVSTLPGCSSPVMFRVEVDEAVASGTLTLNGNSAKLMKNFDGAYWAKWNGSDADGSIEIVFPDAKRARCSIGYVTRGMEVQQFEIQHRKCVQKS